ncbi:ABC transporter ATP-binding protein [Spongiactinospora sp. TRM90649]|uniref:ABC transporter ATP-binding protein n=1 Tax=Spongiactinospora sp. TRM90649 TaxID=3031114 RepID=UPI0023FA1D4E|nr:ABC transporter ATP-binding protein [Spongiactinospora sp. TRM90649]MDF5757214.1 ABC transporter ATP-binding protein [Spongiactinospora sp. TRM90649]
MTLHARLIVERPRFRLDVELTVAAGQVVALLGPNGAGKTTALRAMAGLTPITDGRVYLDGRPLHTMPVEQRPIGVVFQDYLLFPHLSALDNVAFGPRCQGASKRESRRTAGEWLERVGLSEYAGVRPRRLSGGQAQRVALARALAVHPRLLLLDEPLAALDAHTRLTVRSQLRAHLADFDGATVLVTHDPLDAMVLADHLVVIEEGAIVQQGTPAQVARRPRTDYVARLVGLNLYRATAHAEGVTAGGVVFSVAEPLPEPATGPVFVAFRPSAVALYRSRPDGTPRNLWRAVIDGMERHGDNVRIHLNGPIAAGADVTPAAVADLGLAAGQEVWAAVKATETYAYPA